MAGEDLPDGRVVAADLAGNQARSPAGTSTPLTDPLLGIAIEQPRAAVGMRGAIEQPVP